MQQYTLFVKLYLSIGVVYKILDSRYYIHYLCFRASADDQPVIPRISQHMTTVFDCRIISVDCLEFVSHIVPVAYNMSLSHETNTPLTQLLSTAIPFRKREDIDKR